MTSEARFFLGACLFVAGCSAGTAAPVADSSTPESARSMAAASRTDSGPTRLQMRNVDFYVDRDIALRIRRLTGTMRNKTAGPVLFDDKRSFIIAVEAAEVGLTGRDLSLLLNRYVPEYVEFFG